MGSFLKLVSFSNSSLVKFHTFWHSGDFVNNKCSALGTFSSILLHFIMSSGDNSSNTHEIGAFCVFISTFFVDDMSSGVNRFSKCTGNENSKNNCKMHGGSQMDEKSLHWTSRISKWNFWFVVKCCCLNSEVYLQRLFPHEFLDSLGMILPIYSAFTQSDEMIAIFESHNFGYALLNILFCK